jgi:NADPH2:quinone reductase
VLIHAGAGGVGHVAIQLAKIAGARVITTVSSPEKANFVKSLGADEVIYYAQTDVVSEVHRLTEGRGADLVFDAVGGDVFKVSIPATAYFGRLVTLLDPKSVDLGEARMRNLLIGFELMLTPMLRDLPDARDKHVALLKRCSAYIDASKLNIHVSQVLPLAQAQVAHDMIEEGHVTGKLVLSI